MNLKLDTILADRYQIREQLSKKPGRSTFLAQDLESQDLVIIKILRFGLDFQWDDLKLFEREALTLKNLDHPAIPKYLDYFDLDEPDIRGFALVQTYIEAPSLETIIKSGRKFSEPEVIKLADQLLSILTYLHQQIPSVIHRDIKPSNILLSNRSGHNIGDVYLVDFGSVQTAASKEEGTITIVGTYGYIPLEQFGGQTRTTSDLYSLGMTLIYLLTGNHPTELPYFDGQVKFTAEISNQFRRWLEKMTQPQIYRRFDCDRVALTALRSQENNDGDFSNLKPSRSLIELYRDRDQMRIFLPENALSIRSDISVVKKNKKKFPGVASITIKFLIEGIYLLTVLTPIFVIFLICLIPIVPVFLCFCIYETLMSLKEEYYLYRNAQPTVSISLVIDCDTIHLHRSVSGTKTTDRLSNYSSRSNDDFLVYSPGYTFEEYADNSNRIQKVKDRQIRVDPGLQICCSSNKYCIGNGLSEAELYWLGRELSDFLNLELQFIYFAPTVSS